jgi:hypothetical protein
VLGSQPSEKENKVQQSSAKFSKVQQSAERIKPQKKKGIIIIV